jgi:PilZ domain
MGKLPVERRASNRYDVRLPIHYRISQRGGIERSGTGTTFEMSSTGLSFRSRKPLPIGAHLEMIVEWPARYGDLYPIDLQATGFVVRSESGRTAVRVTSRRFRVLTAPAHSVSVSA